MEVHVEKRVVFGEIADPDEALAELCDYEYAGETRWRSRIGAAVTRMKHRVDKLRFNEHGEILRDKIGNSITTPQRVISLYVRTIAKHTIETMIRKKWIEIDDRGRVFVTSLGIDRRLGFN